MDHTAAAMDGSTLVEALHGRGINVRYLGKLAAMLAAMPQLQYLNRIAVSELILRSAKHIFTSYMQVCVYARVCIHPLKLFKYKIIYFIEYKIYIFSICIVELYKHVHFAGYGTDGPVCSCQPLSELFPVIGANHTSATKSRRGLSYAIISCINN